MTQRFSLDGRVIAVTGAAGILGIRFCKELLACGAKVVAIDHDDEAIARLKAAVGSTTALATYRADIRDRSQVAEVRKQAEALFGAVDGLLNKRGNKESEFL
jgi:NADP-dependent 3-hydroxy acid dehydrogenase YdfG